MNQNNFRSQLQTTLSTNQLVLSETKIQNLQTYFELSQKWGAIINITTNLSVESFIAENILDPLLAFHTFSKQRELKNQKLIDLGCGGGYVGLVWKIVCDEPFSLTLLDSDRKKINFCRQVIRDLKLPNAKAIQSRAEDFQMLEKYTVVVSRATWSYDVYQSKALPLLDSQGMIVYLAGANSVEALPELPSSSVLKYQIQPSQIERFLVLRTCQ